MLAIKHGCSFEKEEQRQNKQTKNSGVFTIFLDFFTSGKMAFKILLQEFKTLRKAHQYSCCLLVTVLLVNYSEQSQEPKLTETSLCQLEILFQ